MNARAVKKSWQRVQGVGNTTLLKTETKNLLFSAFYPSNSFIRQTLSLRTMLKLSSARAIPFPASPHAHTAHSTGMHVVVVVAPRRPRLVTRHHAIRPHLTDAHHHRATRYNMQCQCVECLCLVFVRASGDLRRPHPRSGSCTTAGKQGRIKTERWREGRSFDY